MGLILVLIPDQGRQLFTLNDAHGPSWWDLPGMIFLLISWAAMSWNIVSQWKNLLAHFGTSRILLFIAIYLIGIGGIILGLSLKVESLLWLSVLLALSANSILVFYSYKRN